MVLQAGRELVCVLDFIQVLNLRTGLRKSVQCYDFLNLYRKGQLGSDSEENGKGLAIGSVKQCKSKLLLFNIVW